MKKVPFSSARVVTLCGFLAVAGFTAASAQVSTTTTTTSAGTVSEFTPGTITVTSGPSALPVSYASSRTTTYVDENGNPVSVQTIRSGVPVTVYYSQEGDRMVASKVVVRHVVPGDDATVIKKTTTTTTTSPAP